MSSRKKIAILVDLELNDKSGGHEWFIAFPKKPDKGGIPARENIISAPVGRIQSRHCCKNML